MAPLEDAEVSRRLRDHLLFLLAQQAPEQELSRLRPRERSRCEREPESKPDATAPHASHQVSPWGGMVVGVGEGHAFCYFEVILPSATLDYLATTSVAIYGTMDMGPHMVTFGSAGSLWILHGFSPVLTNHPNVR